MWCNQNLKEIERRRGVHRQRVVHRAPQPAAHCTWNSTIFHNPATGFVSSPRPVASFRSSSWRPSHRPVGSPSWSASGHLCGPPISVKAPLHRSPHADGRTTRWAPPLHLPHLSRTKQLLWRSCVVLLPQGAPVEEQAAPGRSLWRLRSTSFATPSRKRNSRMLGG